jgi:pimeloyl-ACP methyl ester carboxylesterase
MKPASKRTVAIGFIVVAILAAIGVIVERAKAADFQPTRFTVTVEGQGPDVILIPGLASSRAVWDTEAARLKGRYRLHLIQVKGFGGEPAGPNAAGPVLQPTVDEIHQYMVANGLTGAPVIGHSMGGLMGLMIAEQHPDDVKRLMIVDSLPFFAVLIGGPNITVADIEPRAARIRDQMLAETQEAYAAGEEAQIESLVKSPAGKAAALAMARASDHAVVGQALYDDLVTDARPDLAKVKAKVVVLYPWDIAAGYTQDAVDLVYQGAFSTLPDRRLVRIDSSLHFIMYDRPDAFDDEVKAFLGH